MSCVYSSRCRRRIWSDSGQVRGASWSARMPAGRCRSADRRIGTTGPAGSPRPCDGPRRQGVSQTVRVARRRVGVGQIRGERTIRCTDPPRRIMYRKPGRCGLRVPPSGKGKRRIGRTPRSRDLARQRLPGVFQLRFLDAPGAIRRAAPQGQAVAPGHIVSSVAVSTRNPVSRVSSSTRRSARE